MVNASQKDARDSSQEQVEALSQEEIRARATELLRALRAAGEQSPVDVTVEGSKDPIELPAFVNKLLIDILANTVAGVPSAVIPLETEWTTQQAADLLNVSRPHLVKLLDTGVIPFKKVGAHRRVRAVDLTAYARQQWLDARTAASELSKLSTEFGLY